MKSTTLRALALSALLAACTTTVVLTDDALTIGPDPIDIVLSVPIRSGVRTNKAITAPLLVKTEQDLPIRAGLQPEPQKSARERGIVDPDVRRVTVKAVL